VIDTARPFSAQPFAAAALDPAMPVPGAAVLNRGHRFAVYRNNVLGGLVRALEARVPMVRRLVDEDLFAGMASAFATRHPPRSPLMFDYGAGMDAFIAQFPPAAGLPYLADVATLEIARGRAFHAADAKPLGLADFAALAGRDIGDLRLLPHPSLPVVRSHHPVVAIWTAHQATGEPAPIAVWHAEYALVFRADDAVAILALPPGEAASLGAVGTFAPLGEASAAALAEAPGFDAGAALARLIGSGLVIALQQDMETEQ